MAITKEFYESDPRSKEIRQVGIAILNRFSLLLSSERGTSQDEISRINSELELLEGQLIGFGITRGMNAGLPEQAYEKDPLTAIQYVLGQIYEILVIPLPSEDTIVGTVGEFNVLNRTQDDSPYLVELTNAPQPLIDFMRAQTMLGILRHFIDYRDEESSL